MRLFHLSDEISFPHPRLASPDGLLAVGGDLSVSRLILAYKMGIFPWYSKGEPILWWSPDPRLVLFPDDFHMSRSLKREIRKKAFRITFDEAFDQVIAGCAAKRPGSEGTWIVPQMAEAYMQLHRIGVAHSVEAWKDGVLAGGLYGVSLGGCFFGESMFSRESNASKVAMAALMRFIRKKGFDLVDCQVKSGHLMRLGAREVPRTIFLEMLEKSMERPSLSGKWHPESDPV
jgi:leucyl/phenylalanyl-tRNA--protein transferase